MITEVNYDILSNIQPFSVILHQCNAIGLMENGLAKEIKILWPQVYDKYKEYCAQFKGHEEKIIGTYLGVNVNDNIIICNAIAQLDVKLIKQTTNYSAWDNICKKLVQETYCNNIESKQNWTIHIQHDIGCGLGGGNLECMREIFFKHFNQSPVELVIHTC